MSEDSVLEITILGLSYIIETITAMNGKLGMLQL